MAKNELRHINTLLLVNLHRHTITIVPDLDGVCGLRMENVKQL